MVSRQEGRTGPRKDDVPNIVGQTTTNADSQVVSAGFDVGSKTTTPATGAQATDIVASQTPSAGTVYPLKEAVDYVYYSPYFPPFFPPFFPPNFRGQHLLEALDPGPDVLMAVVQR